MDSAATKQMSIGEVGVFCVVCGWWNDGLSDVCKDCSSRLIAERPLGGHAIGAWMEGQVGQRDTLGIPMSVNEMNVLHEWVVGVPVLPNVKDAGNASVSGSDGGVHHHDTGAAKSRKSETWKVLLYVSLTIAAVVVIYAAIGFVLLTAPSPSTPQDRQGEYAETIYPSMLVIAGSVGELGVDVSDADEPPAT
jgi:hypothetical protein